MITFSQLGKLGRFGNQLWQVASTVGIAIKNGQEYFFPETEVTKAFKNIPTGEFYAPKYEYFGAEYKDIALHYSADLVGYFQSYKYFEHCKDVISNLFFMYLYTEIDQYTSIHVRRGDYLNLKHVHPCLTDTNYYWDAIDYAGRKSPFYIFSDDIPFCKEYFKGLPRVIFADPTDVDFMQFYYMHSCGRHIIANSSYSWWAAYLSGNEVIAPNIWALNESKECIHDRLPKEWKVIEVENQ